MFVTVPWERGSEVATKLQACSGCPQGTATDFPPSFLPQFCPPWVLSLPGAPLDPMWSPRNSESQMGQRVPARAQVGAEHPLITALGKW